MMTGKEILQLPMQDNDAGAFTVKEYLMTLLKTIWAEGECFSGKRPFGNSSWEFDLYEPLGRQGLIEMTFDEDGYIEEFSDDQRIKADELIRSAIEAL